MKRTSFRRTAAPSVAVLALGLGLTRLRRRQREPSSSDAASAGGTTLSGTLNGAGSSAQEAAQGAWRAGFQTANTDVTVNYDPAGSGGGREQFLAGGVDFAGSRLLPATTSELAAAKKTLRRHDAIEVPDYVSPIARRLQPRGRRRPPALRRDASPASSPARSPSGTTRRSPPTTRTPTLPSTAITPVHRSDESGTTENFTDYLEQAGARRLDQPSRRGVADQVRRGRQRHLRRHRGGQQRRRHRSATPTRARPATSASPRSRSAASTSPRRPRRPPRPSRSRRGSRVAPTSDMAIEVDRTTTEAGAYPLRAGVLPDRLPDVRRRQDKADLVKGYLTYVVGAEGQAAAAEQPAPRRCPASCSDEAASRSTRSGRKLIRTSTRTVRVTGRRGDADPDVGEPGSTRETKEPS